MAQKTFVDGDVLTASDVNTYLAGEGGAWTSYTPTVTQSTNPTFTVSYSKYARYGRTIIWNFALAFTGSGTSANVVSISLPVTATSTSSVNGTGLFYDTSASTPYGGQYEGYTTSSVVFKGDWSGVGVLGTVGFTAAIASGDTIRGSITYEAAS